MPDREDFNSAVAAIRQETKKDTGVLFARLKSLSPVEFVRLPREDLERLSISQYLNIARAIAPDVTLPAITSTRAGKSTETTKRSWSPGRLSLLAIAASVAVGVAWALCGTALLGTIDAMPIVRSGVAADWPRCTRLSADTDGCVYVPGQDLPWAYAATMLDMDLETLRRTNTQLPADRIPQDSRLVVWRFRGTLED